MKAAIYCRLSEEDRNKLCSGDDSNSIQNQKAMLLQYAAEQSWEVYGIYSDDDYTGADRRRPQFNRLLDDARKRRFDVVLCKNQSRFTREMELVEKYIHGLFPLWGIRFVSIVDNADTANKGNKKSRQINGLVNEWYLEDMSDNIRSVLTNRRKNGFHIGAFAPYGYRKDPDQKGHLIIDPEAARVVREIYRLYARGHGKTAIARRLNDQGIPNPTEYKRLQGLRYRNPASHNSTLWKYSAISDILTNEVYIGNMVQGKYASVSYKTKELKPQPKDQWIIVKGTHEPVIQMDLWDQVQARISQRSKPFSNGQIGLFAGKVRCAYCGYTMRSSKQGQRRYLQCQTRYVSKDACIGSFVSVKKLEQKVRRELDRLTERYLDREKLERNIDIASDLNQQRARLQGEITAYRRRIAEYTRGIRELYLDKVRGILHEEDYAALTRDFSKEKKRMEGMAAACENEITEIDRCISKGQSRGDRITRYLTMEHLSRDAVEAFIDHITVYKRVAGTQEVPIDIHWNF